MAEDVDAEARDAGNHVGEIGAVLFLELGLRAARDELEDRLLHEKLFERFLAQGLQRAVQAHARRVARDEMQVRAAFLEHLEQELVDAPWGVLRQFTRAGSAARNLGDRFAAHLRRPASGRT